MQDLAEIKKIRKNINLTQKELAVRANVSQSLIAKIEAQKIDPTYTKTIQIFNALNNINKKDDINVKDIINKNIISISPETEVLNAIDLMKMHNISQLPVISNHPVGLITESALLENITKYSHKELAALKVKDIMRDCPPVLSINCPLEIVTESLRHYPMVLIKEKEKISGLVTKADILLVFSKK